MKTVKHIESGIQLQVILMAFFFPAVASNSYFKTTISSLITKF